MIANSSNKLVLKTQEEGKDSACVFLDCSAAFDTIQHSVLLGKLQLYGVNEKSLRWMKDYLSERSQFVSIGGVPSEIKKIEEGAFQGSISGPWCFLIMINDIVVVGAGNDITVYIYADDTCLRVTLGEDMAENQEKLDELMKKVVRYMDSTKLKFNFKKTEFVITAPKRHERYSRLVLNFDGSVVKQQLHARLLGLQVSWDLQHKWYVSEMKENLLASLSKRLYILERLASKCPKKCVKNFAHGLIFSKLCFGIQYWSRPLPESLWNQLVVLVNRAARAVLKIKPLQMHVLDMYRVLNWLPPGACRAYMDLNLFWNIRHYKTPANLSQMFQSSCNSYYTEDELSSQWTRQTRSMSQQSIRRTQENDSLGIRHTSFVPRMVRTFNALDREFKSLPDIKGTDDERFLVLKQKLRNKCQWDALGFPADWPQNIEEAMLDRGDEIYGLGIESDTTSEEEDLESMT